MIRDYKEVQNKISRDWSDAFPQLTNYTPSKFYKIVGPTIIGIELIKSPHHAKEYRAYFHCYPLWREDLKECLNYPEILIEIKNENGRQFFVPYDKHDLYFWDLCECVLMQTPLSFDGDLRLNDFNEMIDRYSLMPPQSASPNSFHQARLKEFQFNVSLHINTELANKILEQVSKKDWNSKHFERYGTNIEKWLQSMNYRLNHRDEFISRVQTNQDDRKLAKLKKSELLPRRP